MNNRFLTLCGLVFFVSGLVSAQPSESVLKAYAGQFQTEKVHIHFDKDAYLPGETVWMKAYILAGERPSAISHNLYLDLTDASGQILAHTVAPVLDGTASSSFYIPFAISGSAIHVKAYTKWMLNFDSSFLFNKDIPVLQPADGSEDAPIRHLSAIQFFPEGGDLVNGINSEVAFEIIEQHGHPVSARGSVKNGAGQLIDSFATTHNGMGKFRITAQPGEKYQVLWKDEFGQSHENELPAVKASGAVMHVSVPKGGFVHYRVQRSADGLENLKSLTLLATINQQVVFRTNLDLKDQMSTDGTINTNQLGAGVLQLTLFDARMVPLSERISFINKEQATFGAQISKEQTSFTRRGLNELAIEVPDSVESNLSVSVTDGSLGEDTSSNIISDLLLSSELRGYVYDAAAYFNSSADSMAVFLDLVMQTHGWRRFPWEDAMTGKLPQVRFPADEDCMEIRGKISAQATAFEAGDSVALLILTKDHKKRILNLPISADGSFVQKGVFFYDSIQIAYRVNHPAKLSASSQISILTNLGAQASAVSVAGTPDFSWTRVPDVILEKESNGLLEETSSTSRQASILDYVFTPAVKSEGAKTGFETATHYLQDNFPELHFPQGQKDPSSSSSAGDNTRYASLGSTAPVSPIQKNNVNLLLDGNPVSLEDLKQLTMKDVLYIKFLQKNNPKDLPALAITSRQSIDQDNILNNKTGFALLAGYAPAREFYSPVYQHTTAADEGVSGDFRSTLYWNPKLLFDKTHRKIKISFYNNDMTTKFRLVLEGFNADGKLVRAEEMLK